RGRCSKRSSAPRVWRSRSCCPPCSRAPSLTSFPQPMRHSAAPAALLAILAACAGAPQTAPLPSSGWIDVSASLDSASTPIYEGDAPMHFEFLHDMRRGEAFTLSVLSLGAHSGTHVDAPMHFVRDGMPIDRIALEPFVGRARVIDVPDSVQAIDAAVLGRYPWRGAERVLFRTR